MKLFCWTSHCPKAAQNTERVTPSNKRLRQLCSIEHYGWQSIIILDEPWFYLSTNHEHIWLCTEE
jgi:hypothetical protein